jgi:hypothetical protein
MPYATNYASATYASLIAHAVLSAAVATLTSPPTIQYVSAGKPAATGCDQLVVWVDAFKLVRPRPASSRGGGAFAEERNSLFPQGSLPALDMQVQLIRCGAPGVTGELDPANPSATDLDAFATAQLTDGWALYHGLFNAAVAQTLFAGLEHVPAAVVIGQGVPYGTEGGLAGWTVPVTVGLY